MRASLPSVAVHCRKKYLECLGKVGDESGLLPSPFSVVMIDIKVSSK
jgi:hypothetical protein